MGVTLNTYFHPSKAVDKLYNNTGKSLANETLALMNQFINDARDLAKVIENENQRER